MLPPLDMLAIKNGPFHYCCVLVSLIALWGCKVSPNRPLIEGERLIQEGRYQEAAFTLQKATRLMPTNAQALNHLGLAYHGAGQFDQAERAYRQALGLDRKLAAAHYNLGCLYLEQDKLQAALDELTSYTFLEPRSLSGKLKLARAQRRLGDLAAAEKAYQDVLQLRADHPDALNGLGLIEVARRRPLDANYYFKRVLDQNPKHPQAMLNLAILAHQHLDNQELATKFYQTYLQLDPRPINAAEVQRTLAILAPALAQSTSPTNVAPVLRAENTSRSNLAQRSAAQKNQAQQPTRYKYRNLAKPRAGNRLVAEPYFRAGVAAQGANRLSEAVVAYRRAVQADPGYYEAYFNLGLAAYQLENWADALNAYEFALVLSSDSADARYNFALALKRAGHPLDAAHQLQRLLADKPKEARAYLSLANLYLQQLDDLNAARTNYTRFVELVPNHPETPRVRDWLKAKR